MLDAVRELILHHNADMFAVDGLLCTPFDVACDWGWGSRATVIALIEMYGNQMMADHGRLALHEILTAAKYSYPENRPFRSPLNPLRIQLPLGTLAMQHWRTLFQVLDMELIGNRDDEGKLPIHIACRKNAPMEVLSVLVELDPAMLQISDYTGALPLHECCCGSVDYSSVRYLVEQGGVGTLAARNHQGALPLHSLCGSTNPPWRCVQYLIQSFPGSVLMETNAGEYPFMIAATSDSSSMSVVYELVRVNPDVLIVPLRKPV